jgi:hypothetical protein
MKTGYQDHGERCAKCGKRRPDVKPDSGNGGLMLCNPCWFSTAPDSGTLPTRK